MVKQEFIPTIKDENPDIQMERVDDSFWDCRMCGDGRYSIEMVGVISKEGHRGFMCSSCGHKVYTDIDWSKYKKPTSESLEIDAKKWRQLKHKLSKIEKHTNTLHDLILEVDADTPV